MGTKGVTMKIPMRKGRGGINKEKGEKEAGSGGGRNKNRGSKSPGNERSGKIQFRLYAAFFIPIACIILLGVVSYQKAADTIIKNYEQSMYQTLSMTGEYYTLNLNTIREKAEEYYEDTDIRDYYSGLYTISPTKEITFYNATLKAMKKKVWADEFIQSIYILSDTKKSMAVKELTGEKPYSGYMATAEGRRIGKDSSSYHWFGTGEDADKILSADSSTYALRLVRNFPDSGTCIIVDVKKKELLSILEGLKLGNNSIQALILGDGTEYLSGGKSGLKASVAKEDFYQEAIKSGKAGGYSYEKFQDKEYLFTYSKIEDTGAVICSLIPRSNMLGQVRDIRLLTFVIVAAASIISTGLCSLIAGGIGKTIRQYIAQLKKVAAGDLTVAVTCNRGDEFKVLGDEINSMIRNMKGLLLTIKDMGGQLFSETGQSHEISRIFVSTSKEIDTSIGEIEKGILQLDENAADCLKQMDMLSEKITHVNDSTARINGLCTSTAQSAKTGMDTVMELKIKNEAATAMTEEVIEKILHFDENSRKIESITASIKKIASQTNLLALNASIESARAGIYGKGFAVVAEEIRKLAEESLEAAALIREIIGEIAMETKETVTAARKAEEVVKQQTEAVKNTEESFDAMEGQIERLGKELSLVLEHVKSMEKARGMTFEAVVGISAVSRETAASAAEVSMNTKTQLSSVSRLDASAENLYDKAEQLEQAMEQFIME